MAKAPRRAAIYARISSDPEGTALGVQRQLKDCRAMAKRQGWAVGEEYVDNDISAYSGKQRPAYERMLGDISDGLRDGLIVYHLDRLTRRPIELEQFVAITETRPGFVLQTVAGGGDIGSGDGLMVARIMSSVAANESAAKSRRIKRKQLDLAERGLPSFAPLTDQARHETPHAPGQRHEFRCYFKSRRRAGAIPPTCRCCQPLG